MDPASDSLFTTEGGHGGRLVVSTAAGGAADPFLPEERELLDSVACMLGTWCRRREAEAALEEGRQRLEHTVRTRTRQLKHANRRLRRLASELCLTEARERRELASHLHDEIGQSLALLRMKLGQVRANQVFSGCDPELDSVQRLLERTLRSTRTLTQSLSPPVLYELGLGPACHWLGERLLEKHGLPVECHTDPLPPAGEALQVTLFKCAQELLNNCWRHGQARRVRLELACRDHVIQLQVEDDGCGFDPRTIRSQDGFGLFSIRTRLRDLGGRLEITSAPGMGCRAGCWFPWRARHEHPTDPCVPGGRPPPVPGGPAADAGAPERCGDRGGGG
jgi:signal transduction histidine kinase